MIMYFPDKGRMDDEVMNRDPVGRYILSYSSLREDYLRFTLMSDEDFLGNLLDILHFSCVVCWMKEKQTQWILSDVGLIHELVHLMVTERDGSDATSTSLEKIRDLFNQECCLA